TFWYAEDPKGFDAGDANLRRVVGNNPTNLLDPSGKIKITPVGDGLVSATKAGEKSQIDWSFELDAPAPEAGYLIQRVQVFYLKLKELPKADEAILLPTKADAEVFEAFPVFMDRKLLQVQTGANPEVIRLKHTARANFTGLA